MLDRLTLNKVFYNLPAATLIVLPDTPVFTVMDVNNKYLLSFQATANQLIGKGFFEYLERFQLDDKSIDLDSFISVISTKQAHTTDVQSYEYPVPGSDKTQTRYFYATNVPVLNDEGEVEHIIHTVTDVTETIIIKRRQDSTKKSLKEAAVLMSQGQELANFGNWQWDIIKDKVSWSDTLYHIYGLDKTTFKATFEGYQELIHPDDKEYVIKQITGVLARRADVVFEERIIRPGGEIRYLKSWGKVQVNEQNIPVKMIGACLDITDSKVAQAHLHQLHQDLEAHLKTIALSEKRYSNLFHLSPVPMWIFNLDTRKFINVNAAAIEHYGYSLEEFVAMDAAQLWPETFLAEFENAINSTNQFFKGITTQIKKNGEPIQVFIQSSFVEFSGQNTHLMLASDITERQNYIRAIEEKNQHLQEIAWIQSHVVRAPLARIMGLIDLFKTHTADELDQADLLDKIIISANELDGIIRGISDITGEVL